MKKSKIFHTGQYKKIEKRIRDALNGQPDFLLLQTIDKPRAVGDAIESILAENFASILGNLCKEYSSQFARRAMADFAFSDKDDLYYIVDVKTHRLDTKFNMPNLSSVERLSRFYEDDANYFVVLKVDYRVDNLNLIVDKVLFVPIEFLSWDCLTLGALGWGQIQIANSNNVVVSPSNKRKDWMIEMCDNILDFYPKEILKIEERIDHFRKVKEYWEGKDE